MAAYSPYPLYSPPREYDSYLRPASPMRVVHASPYAPYMAPYVVSAPPVTPAALAPEIARVEDDGPSHSVQQRMTALENENARLAVKIQSLQHSLQLAENQFDRASLDAEILRLQERLAMSERHNAELTDQIRRSGASAPVVEYRQDNDMLDSQKTLLRKKDDELLALRTRAEQQDRNLNELSRKLMEREKELAELRNRASINESELNKRQRAIEQSVAERTAGMQQTANDYARVNNELKAVYEWWKKKNTGCCASKDPAPWKGLMGPQAPAQTLPPILAPGSRAITTVTGDNVPYIGLAVDTIPGVNKVKITNIEANSPAQRAQCAINDEVVSFAGKPTQDLTAFRTILKENMVIGRVIPVVLAGNEGRSPQRTTSITVGQRARATLVDVPQIRTVEDVEDVLKDPRALERAAGGAFYSCDTDFSGVITPSEFANGMRVFLPPELAKWVPENVLTESFGKGDEDNSGFLVATEFTPTVEFVFRQIVKNARSQTAVSIGKPWLGLAVKSNPASGTLIIKDAVESGPAYKAGLRDGDVLVSFAGVPCTNVKAFKETCGQYASTPGQSVPIVFTRGAANTRMNATLIVGSKQKEDFSNLPVISSTADLRAVMADRALMNRVAAAAFQHCDDDLSGLVTRKELPIGLRSWLSVALAQKISDSELQALFDHADDDRSGFLGKTEFPDFLESVFETIISKESGGRSAATAVGKPYIGMALKSDGGIMMVRDVTEGGPSDLAGIKDGDSMMTFGGMVITSTKVFVEAMKEHASVPGNVVPVYVKRQGKDIRTSITVGEKRREEVLDVPPLRTAKELELVLADRNKLAKASAAAFSHADEDLSGLVTKKEAVASMRSWLSPALASRVSEGDVLKMFERCDADNSGFLSKSEYPKFVEAVFQEVVRRS